MIQAIALDDEPLALKVIENYCKRNDAITLLKSFHKVGEALLFLEKNEVDLLFLDIEMPFMNGVRLTEELPEHVQYIFTTAYDDFAVKAFEINAVDYLLKPFSYDRFCTAVEKIKPSNADQNYLLIRTQYQLQKIDYDTIVLIESLNDYIQLSLHNGEKITARQTLKSILEKLPATQFSRVHRSFIVPVKDIKSIAHNTITLKNDQIIPVGKAYRENIKEFK